MTARDSRRQRLMTVISEGALLAVTGMSLLAILFILFFIGRDAIPFFAERGFSEFFASVRWYPSREPAEFGALSILVGSGLVTLGAVVVAVPLGIVAAICLSDVLPFSVRQVVKPVMEILTAIPSVAFGFFALVVLAPLLQERGGHLIGVTVWVVGAPVAFLAAFVASDLVSARAPAGRRALFGVVMFLALAAFFAWVLWRAWAAASAMTIPSGTNALNVAVILGIMALPTVISVSEDSLQAVGRELREGSYALGATRAETLLLTVVPAASSGIAAAVILGIMRAIGETMVVWMASGNAAQIPQPWYDVLQPVRTLTATIAGDMGEADQTTGSARYHVLFAMALVLLVISLAMNLASEWIVRRQRRKVAAG
jgi:phosphate transport system permease protein